DQEDGYQEWIKGGNGKNEIDAQGAQHQKLAVGQIEDIGYPKDKGEAKGRQGIYPSLEDSGDE
ncbi:unnamed protein product, partial [marine sediment metagenome]